jgi:Protein of unknown function (DUF2867)
MSSTAQEIPIPADCSLHDSARSAYFADAFTALVPRSELTAMQIYLAVAGKTPPWVDFLMATRNRVVSWVGLKNVGEFASSLGNVPPSPQPGQRIGIFSFVRATPSELVVQDDDKHLLVQLSILKSPVDGQHDRITISTVVHIHNWLGRLYMLPVGPAHKLIAPAVVRQAHGAVAQAIETEKMARDPATILA